MRRFKIININRSADVGVPSYIDIGNADAPLIPENNTELFHGKEWIDQSGTRFSWATYGGEFPIIPIIPYGTTLLVATTFKIVENEKYDGTYTVYTQPNGGLPSSEFVAGATRVRINESIPVGAGAELTDGFVTNVSVYRIDIAGEASRVVLEKEFTEDRPFSFTGKLFTGWGEVMANNMVRAIQNYSGMTPPDDPFLGQTWFREDKAWMHVWDGVSWLPLNAKYEHVQLLPATTWSVPHGLEKTVVDVTVFVDTVNGVKVILPQDITFDDDDNLTITLSNPSVGVVRVSR